ncbi:MAG: prepilin-type N-terminal cleavage/methylation domain-containing protein [Limisphaerales bacterium]
MKTKIKSSAKHRWPCHDTAQQRQAFSLLEVMIAIAIFFLAAFSILALVSSSLGNARSLQRPKVSAAMLAGELSLTNQLVEGTYSGDFGELYPGYTWKSEIIEEQTNKLFRVNYIVQSAERDHPVVSQMSVVLFRPQSPAGSLDGATTARR